MFDFLPYVAEDFCRVVQSAVICGTVKRPYANAVVTQQHNAHITE